ncbi:MAG: hypothetical protein HYV09_17530 [Deltaproteobacteria bacterium]|nr:hypothetical protein [Deltaproteobacteria bacterium]
MDESTAGVTLNASLVLTVIEPFRGMERLCAPLFEMVRDIDPASRPHAPIALYNDVCAWIEDNLGAAHLRAAGASIGRSAFMRLRREGAIAPDAGPTEALAALARAVLVTIQDPKKRGWELLDSTEGRVILRRTQTFNCVMQEGALLEFVRGTAVTMPRVDQLHCTRRGESFCEYEIKWLPKRQSRTMTPVRG